MDVAIAKSVHIYWRMEIQALEEFTGENEILFHQRSVMRKEMQANGEVFFIDDPNVTSGCMNDICVQLSSAAAALHKSYLS